MSLENIRLQLFREDYAPISLVDRNHVAVRPLAPGLVQAIVEDSGAGERTLQWADLRASGRSDDELFDIARWQTEALDDAIESQTVDNLVQVYISNGFYMSARLLASFVNDELDKGVLFVPLSWHHWCVHIVDDLTVEPVIPMMELIAHQIAPMMKVADAERLVDDVYWAHPGGRMIERVELVGQGEHRRASLSATLADTLAAF